MAGSTAHFEPLIFQLSPYEALSHKVRVFASLVLRIIVVDDHFGHLPNPVLVTNLVTSTLHEWQDMSFPAMRKSCSAKVVWFKMNQTISSDKMVT